MLISPENAEHCRIERPVLVIMLCYVIIYIFSFLPPSRLAAMEEIIFLS
uniref:Uncharacterized protein n=1 Tax=Anguilla anguilla TaxID=7936 RepID=A0A0E9W3H8_ANGAN